MNCKFCQSDKVVRNGRVNGKQLYRCKECKHQYIDNGNFAGMRTKDTFTSAQAAGLNIKPDWGELIQRATISNIKKNGVMMIEEVIAN